MQSSERNGVEISAAEKRARKPNNESKQTVAELQIKANCSRLEQVE